MARLERDTAIIIGLSDAKNGEFDDEKNLQVVVPDSGLSSQDNLNEPDGIHDDLVFPTDEERVTLRRVTDHIPWNAFREYSGKVSFSHADYRSVIAIIELAERFSVSVC